MSYTINKTDGNDLVTLLDGTTNTDTGLTLIGRNYTSYGEIQNENFVRLLENFANTTAPAKPVQGQLWFNNAPNSRRLLVSYDGTNFRDVANVPYSSSAPKNATTGDLWWDSINSQIKVYDSVLDTWTASQPNGGAGSAWVFDRILDSNLVERNSIRASLAGVQMLAVSNVNFTPDVSANLPQFPVMKKGIVLSGADPTTGVSATSTSTGYLLWGTSADALKAQTIDISENTNTGTYFLTFATGTSGRRS